MGETKLIIPDGWQVPDFELTEFRPKECEFCVLVLVLNEGDRFKKQLTLMSEANLGTDIVVADGGSTDGATATHELASRGVTALLVKRGPGRLSAQLRMGFAYAILRGYRGIVTIDGNGKDGFEAIPNFVAALREGYDFVQGSRYIREGKSINTPFDREIGVRLIHAPLLSLAAGFRYTDTTNGFRAFTVRFLTDERVQPFRDVFDTYNLHYYLSVRAPRLGFRVKELPVRRAYPTTGPTPSKISGLRGRLHILKKLFLTVAGAYNPR